MLSIKVERGGDIHTYTLLEKLGKGSYSQVYKCKRTINGHDEIFVCFLCVLHRVGCESVQQILPPKRKNMETSKWGNAVQVCF